MFRRALDRVLLGLALIAATLAAACRYQPIGPAAALPQSETASQQCGQSLIGGVLLAVAVVAGLAAVWWFRLRRAPADTGRTLNLDRQDMALLRTAIESAGLLLGRARRRLRLVNWRGPRA